MEHQLHGLTFVVSVAIRDRLKYRLNSELEKALEPGQLEEFNQWSASTFGYDYHMISMDGKIYCSPAALEYVKNKETLVVLEHSVSNGSFANLVKVK